MKSLFLSALLSAIVACAAADTALDLGAARDFAILASMTVTINSIVSGNVGVYPGGATGFPPAVLNGVHDSANTVAFNAQAALASAYDTAAGKAADTIQELAEADAN
ncbi:hypothetical protein B484DRAFT_425202 [Ochromonadaceae sp. CCMP2298]|nr:hypothetical protein B484DRAFT_425202 [Ochromonadaceae sp. CCMP2298]